MDLFWTSQTLYCMATKPRDHGTFFSFCLFDIFGFSRVPTDNKLWPWGLWGCGGVRASSAAPAKLISHHQVSLYIPIFLSAFTFRFPSAFIFGFSSAWFIQAVCLCLPLDSKGRRNSGECKLVRIFNREKINSCGSKPCFRKVSPGVQHQCYGAVVVQIVAYNTECSYSKPCGVFKL